MILREKNEKTMLGVDRSSSYSSTCSDPAMQRIDASHISKPSTPRTIDRKKQKVTFTLEPHTIAGYIRNRRDLTEKEKDDLYIDSETNIEIRKQAKLTAKYYRLKDIKSINLLDDCFASIRELSCDLDNNESPTTQEEEEEELAKLGLLFSFWTKKMRFSGRGLERYCSAKQRDARSYLVSDTRKAVLCMATEPTVTPEGMANFYWRQTRQSRLLARAMGCADAAAVGNPT